MAISSNPEFSKSKPNWSLHVWIYHWMPWIRSILQLPNDDTGIIHRLSTIGINEPIRKYFRNTSIISNLNPLPTEYFEDFEYFNFELLHQKFDNFSFKKKVISFAAGPSLSSFVNYLPSLSFQNTTIFAADGATRFLVDQGLIPDIVVSDFDGITINLIKDLVQSKTHIIGLTHGDNVDQSIAIFEELGNHPYLHWATQGIPFNGWINTYGFTDGDRSINLIANLIYNSGRVRNVIPTLLVGYDLKSQKIGKYSKPIFTKDQPMTHRKSQKLQIAWKIIEWVEKKYKFSTVNNKMSPGTEVKLNKFLDATNR